MPAKIKGFRWCGTQTSGHYACIKLLRSLLRSRLGSNAKTLCTAALSLLYSTAEYCASVCCHSTHIRLIDSVLDDALHAVTGCLRPTLTDHLPILFSIQPADLCRLGATLSLTFNGFMDYEQMFYGLLSGSSDARHERLRSTRKFVQAARNLLNNLAGLGIRASQ